MKQFFAALAFIAALVASAPAGWQSRDSNYSLAVGASYTGPGDIVSGATAWYGLRAYNAAYATGSKNAVNYRRASDNATQNGVILATGAFDIATANTFAGTDATCTGTISSTTLTCASASSTPHAGSTLTGAGITQPSYIVSCGTFTAGAGTCTLNAAQTVSVGETITMQYGLYLTEVYDQTSNGYNVTQATASSQPQLLPICINTLPCVMFDGISLSLIYNTPVVIPQPYTFSNIAIRIGKFTQYSGVGGTGQIFWGWNNSANTWRMNAGFFVIPPAADNAWHLITGVFNGASSTFNLDGTPTSESPGTGATGLNISWGFLYASSSNQYFLDGYETEQGIWPSGFSSTQQTNICHNQYLYWTTSVSC